MTALERALSDANRYRLRAQKAVAAGNFAEADEWNRAADHAMRAGIRAEILADKLENLAERAGRGLRARRRWRLAMWAVGAKPSTLWKLCRTVGALS